MDFLNNVGDSFKSFAGDIPRAMLVVRNPDSIPRDEYDYFKKSPEGSEKESMNALGKMQKDLETKYKSAKGKALRFDDVKGLMSGGELRNKYVVMEVQYNPSSIRLDTSAGGSYQTANGKLEKITYPVATTLNVQLIFDDMNVMDAFMLSNLNPNLGNAGSLIRDKIGGNEENGDFNVQTQLDGILALLQRAETRFVMFIWSGIFFPGEVCNVAVKYSMFNKSGNPVRGTADIQIRQSQEVQKDAKGKEIALESYWEKAYKEFFEDDSTAAGGFSKVNNNILNINM